VGAVGSGVWDLFLKRAVFWLWDRTAALAAFGFSSIRNVPYQEAARGSPHESALYFLTFAVAIMFGLTISKVDPPLNIQLPETEQEARLLRLRLRWIYRALVFAMFIFANIQIGQVRLTYHVVDTFDRDIAALAPLIDPKDAARLRLAFTRMESREDFLALMTQMADRAIAAGIELPRGSR
jgi:hypothetical protein